MNQRHQMKQKLLYPVFLAALLLCLFGCNSSKPAFAPSEGNTPAGSELTLFPTITKEPEITATPIPTLSPTPTSTPTPTPKQLSLLAVGDDLVHGSTLNGGLQADGTYDFNGFYANLKDEISAADLAIINQETILGGSEFEYSGYPTFNTPNAMGDAIVNAGFDVVLHATNHTMDKRGKGVLNCLHFWKETYPDITVLGIYESKEEQDTIKVIEKNGFKIAMLNYTYGLNGIKKPDGMDYLVTLLTWDNRDFIREQIRKAKEISDFVIVFPHWGTEYVYEPDKNQTAWTAIFAEEGVDLVIGTHPHVLEPVEWVERPDGGKMLVFYSLGNFISGQIEAPRILGGMAQLTLREETDGSISINDVCVVPVITHYSQTVGDGTYSIYRLSEYTEELAALHGIHKRAEYSVFTIKDTWELAYKILGDYLKE